MNESPPLLSRPAKGVALIELNRPDAANRLQPDDLATLLGHLDSLERDAEEHALVLTANGPHFCAGFDLRALLVGLQSGERVAQGDNAFEALADRLEATRLITIAAMHGAVVGGAPPQAQASDMRIGT